MAGNVTDTRSGGAPLVGGDTDSFMRLMKGVLERIEAVDKATVKANDSLVDYADTFNNMNEVLNKFVKLSKDANTSKFGAPRDIGTSGGSRNNYSNRASGTAVSTRNYDSEINRIRSRNNDLIISAVNNMGGQAGKIVTDTFTKITDSIADVKSMAKIQKTISVTTKARNAETVAVANGAKASTAAAGGTAAMSKAAVAAGATVAVVAVALGAMAASAKYAYDRNMAVTRSLLEMGDTASETSETNSELANKRIEIKNTFERIVDDIGEGLEGTMTKVLGIVLGALAGVETLTDNLDKDKSKFYTSSDSKAKWYTQALERNSGIPEAQSLPVIGDIAGSAKQSGFDNKSAANLAIGTFDLATKKAQVYGEQATDVAKRLGDAWLKGTDAAKKYGVVMNDQVLAGYMASKGVDIVNTQITEAMTQYYRYQLMEEQLNADSSDAMQEQVKEWKKLGTEIDATKQKLFSFDEVIQLGAVDSNIPIVGTPNVSYPSKQDGDELPIIPGFPNMSGGTGGLPIKGNAVDVKVNVENLAEVGELEKVLELILEKVPVTVPVAVPGLVYAEGLKSILEWFKGNAQTDTVITTATPGLNNANELYNLCRKLSNVFMCTVSILVPGLPTLSMAATLADYVADKFEGTVDLKVLGLELLQKAQVALGTVLAYMSALGNNIKQGVVSTGKSVAGNVKAFGNGFANSGSASGLAVLKSYSPTSSDAYGGNALAADWDFNLVRLGIKDKTKEGYTTQQLREATAGYIGANLNPFNKGSAAQGLAITAGLSVAGPQVAGALGSLGAKAGAGLAGLGSAIPAFGFATGGIGTKEMTARLFEGDKKEAVIPLESSDGVSYLANAMREAGAIGGDGASGDTIIINNEFSGLNVADNESQWQWISEKIAEKIEIQRQKRGGLNYGSGF